MSGIGSGGFGAGGFCSGLAAAFDSVLVFGAQLPVAQASFKAGSPAWEKIAIPGLQTLPAVRWKLENVSRLKQKNPRKHADLRMRLADRLKN